MNQSLSYEVDGVMPAVRATGLQVSLATFQAPVQDFSSGMQPDSWTDVAGLVDIHSQFGEWVDGSVQASEMRTQPLVTSEAYYRLELDDLYPAVKAGWRNGWRVVVTSPGLGAIAYDLSGVENDSQSQVTRCKCCEASI